MGMVTFALFLLFFDRVQRRTGLGVLPRYLLRQDVRRHDRRVLVLLILSTVLNIFHTVLKTVTLDVRQWLICAAVALSIVVAAEIRKAVLRQTAAKPSTPPVALGRSHDPLSARRVPDMAEYAPVRPMAPTASRHHEGTF